jgi:hypothetical protein
MYFVIYLRFILWGIHNECRLRLWCSVIRDMASIIVGRLLGVLDPTPWLIMYITICIVNTIMCNLISWSWIYYLSLILYWIARLYSLFLIVSWIAINLALIPILNIIIISRKGHILWIIYRHSRTSTSVVICIILCNPRGWRFDI